MNTPPTFDVFTRKPGVARWDYCESFATLDAAIARGRRSYPELNFKVTQTWAIGLNPALKGPRLQASRA